jgi:hypothetical protein
LPCSALNLLLFQRTDVTYELLDLVVGELALPWHLAFAVFGDLRQLGVGLLLHVVRAEITKLQGFPHGSVALAVRAVAGRALCLEEAYAITLRPDRPAEKKQDTDNPQRVVKDLSSNRSIPSLLGRISANLVPLDGIAFFQNLYRNENLAPPTKRVHKPVPAEPAIIPSPLIAEVLARSADYPPLGRDCNPASPMARVN